MRTVRYEARFAFFYCLSQLLLVGIARAADCGDTLVVCACGDTVVNDYTLTSDLICPPAFTGNALTIGADGITIDGQGLYRIEAPNATAVIQNRLHSGWTLQNIAIRGGLFGIQSDARPLPNGAQSISILNVDASSQQDFGQRIRFLDTHMSRVEGSQADGGATGIYNLNGDDNRYVNTTASWRPEYGPLPAGQTICVELIGVRDNLIDGVTGNARQLGVVLRADTGNPNWGSRTADRNIVQSSDFSGNQSAISFAFEGDGNQFLGNDLSGSADISLAINGDSGVIIEGNDYSDSFIGINLSNLDAQGRTVLANVDLTTISGTYGLRVHNVRNAGFEQIEIGGGTRQSLWWSGGSTGNTFHQITAGGHTFGLLSQAAHDNLVTDSDFSWAGADRQSVGIDLRQGSSGNVFDNVTVHQRLFGAQILQGGRANTLRNSDLSDNHNCVFANTNDPAAQHQFMDLKLNGCTGNALTVAFDNLLEVRDIDFGGSSVGLALSGMSGVGHDGQAQGLNLSEVQRIGLSLIDVDDSSFGNFELGGIQRGVSLTTSDRNLLSKINTSWAGQAPSGDGLFLDRSVENVIRESSVANRARGLQILSGSNDNEIHCNSLTHNLTGVLNHFGAGGNHLNLNRISGNSDHGVRNTEVTTLDATENYWGAADGPGPAGSGDLISGPVDVAPFLNAPGDLNAPCGRVEVPREVKAQAIELLEAVLPSGTRRIDKRLRKSKRRIVDSLAVELWLDDEHLIKDDGKEVFKAEKRAARELMKLLDEELPENVTDAVVQTLANLLLADLLLAETALMEASTAIETAGCESSEDGDSDSDSEDDSDSGGDSDSDSDGGEPECDCDQALSDLTQAEEELADAQSEIDAGRFDRAIGDYKRGWQRALRASCAVAGCEPGR